VKAANGGLKWSHQLSDYGLPANTVARATPAVVNNVEYVVTQQGAWLLAINALNGKLKWKTQLESVDPFAVISTAPVVSGGVIYTGVASTQEDAAAVVPGFVCCTSRGSVVAVNATNGAIIWKTYTIPTTGFSGAGVWGSGPVVDTGRNTVFIGTGNNDTHPTDAGYLACIGDGGTEASCLPADDHVDSILALDMTTGAIKWATREVDWGQADVIDGSDDWNVSCIFGNFSNCPSSSPTGPDYDFASGPNEITYQTESGPKTIIGAGQKSGIYYALDPDTGAELWRTQVGPGSSLGGMEWGSASDGQRIYVSITNYYGIPYNAGSAGSWAALDPATGAILWQTPDPNGSNDIGPVSVANGVVYAPSMAGAPGAQTFVALDASSGTIRWSAAAGASVISGATIVRSDVYWGSGYAHLGIPGFTGNNQFFALSLNGK
jgi:polyvinyl alcohol dehydrogenase (cytochrome)